jgi:hypothetical protein
MVKINRYFKQISTILTAEKSGIAEIQDQIWINRFDHEHFVILGIVMVRIGLTTLTIEPQFSQSKNRGHRTTPNIMMGIMKVEAINFVEHDITI